MLPPPKMKVNVVLPMGMAVVLVIHMEVPTRTICMPSVTRKLGRFSATISRPLIRPTTRPTASAARMASGMLSVLCRTSAAIRPDRPMVEPTDRSISPMAITNVMVTAIMETTAVWRMMFRMLLREKNDPPMKMANRERTTRKMM